MNAYAQNRTAIAFFCYKIKFTNNQPITVIHSASFTMKLSDEAKSSHTKKNPLPPPPTAASAQGTLARQI